MRWTDNLVLGGGCTIILSILVWLGFSIVGHERASVSESDLKIVTGRGEVYYCDNVYGVTHQHSGAVTFREKGSGLRITLKDVLIIMEVPENGS